MPEEIAKKLSETSTKKDARFFKIFLALVFSSMLLTGLISSAIYFTDFFLESRNSRLHETARVEAMKEATSDFFHESIYAIKIITESSATRRYIDTNSVEDLELFSENLLLLANSHRDLFDQIRYIDEHGLEQLRVEDTTDGFNRIPSYELQDKSERYYVQAGLLLEEGQLYISELDLNIENGVIEIPEKPVIRFVAPMFSNDGTRKGLIVTNVNAQVLLSRLETLYLSDPGELIITNHAGYFLHHPDPNLEWGFLYPDRKDFTYAQLEPDFWNLVHPSGMGRHDLKNKTFTYDVFNPKAELVTPFEIVTQEILENELHYHIHIISTVTDLEIHADSNLLLFRILLINGFALLILAVFSWFLAKNLTYRKQVELKISRLYSVLKTINRILRHDIRNKLMRVKYAFEMDTNLQKSEWMKEAFAAADDGIELIERMKELEQLASEGKQSLKPTDLREVIDDVKKKYPIKFTVKGSTSALADGAIYSIIDNIIGNAVRHGKTKKMTITIAKKNGHVEIKLADYGKGIPEKIKSNMFKEGFKYGKSGNTGLGLFIVHETVKRYGGSISVQKTKPQGATFVLTLKAAKG